MLTQLVRGQLLNAIDHSPDNTVIAIDMIENEQSIILKIVNYHIEAEPVGYETTEGAINRTSSYFNGRRLVTSSALEGRIRMGDTQSKLGRQGFGLTDAIGRCYAYELGLPFFKKFDRETNLITTQIIYPKS